GDVFHHDRVGSDFRAIADHDRAEDFRARPDHDTVTERRMPLAGVPGSAAVRNSMIERAIVADFSGLPDHDAHAVIDEEAPSDTRAGMDFDPRQETSDVRSKACEPF